MKKIILTAISSFITLCVLALDSGRCGENVTWVFDESTETLTISGSGKMHDYSPNDGIKAPWKRYAYSTFSYSIKKIYIKDGVTSIGSYAFTTCKNLISIEIPNSVTSIGEGAFWGCTELTTFVIPNSVTNIGQKAFYGTQWYKNQGKLIYAGNVFYEDHTGNQVRELKAGTTGIADGAFSTNSALTSVTIPNSVKSIGKKAFEGCSNLPSIVIPRSVTSIGECAFSGCSSMISIDIPSGVRSIENQTFYKCTGLTSVSIPNSVTSIGNNAFYGCTGLKTINVPDNINYVGQGAFYGTEWVKNQPSGIIYVGKVAYSCKNISTKIQLKEGTTYIAENAFRSSTGLVSIDIPNSVTGIGNYAFWGCSGLMDAFCYADNVPSSSSIAFDNSSINNATLHVPAASVNAYKSTAPWSGFKEIIAIPGTEPSTYRLTYIIDGIDYKSYIVEEGTFIIPEPEPTKEGYTFSGWSEIPETMPAHDVTITGTFTLNTAINQIIIDKNGNTMIFMIDGKRVNKLQKNLNIIRMKDGTTRKVIKK